MDGKNTFVEEEEEGWCLPSGSSPVSGGVV
jgi:hypothetical protein